MCKSLVGMILMMIVATLMIPIRSLAHNSCSNKSHPAPSKVLLVADAGGIGHAALLRGPVDHVLRARVVRMDIADGGLPRMGNKPQNAIILIQGDCCWEVLNPIEPLKSFDLSFRKPHCWVGSLEALGFGGFRSKDQDSSLEVFPGFRVSGCRVGTHRYSKLEVNFGRQHCPCKAGSSLEITMKKR